MPEDFKEGVEVFHRKRKAVFRGVYAVKPPVFKYLAPASLDEAVAALADDEAKVLAGGQSLVPMLNFRLLAPSLLVDIGRIPGLDYIKDNGAAGLRIGAMTRHHSLETSELVRQRFPVLNAAMQYVAHLAIRNRGTIGGSLCHADPAAELPGLMLLLDAQLVTTQRTIAAVDFYQGTLDNVLAEDEILTEIQLPALPAGTGLPGAPATSRLRLWVQRLRMMSG